MPDLIYHYTTADGLLGILQDASLLATDMHFLNDRSEWEYQVKLAVGCANWLDTLDLDATQEPFARHWAFWLRNFSIVENERLHCVSCFCAHGDLLSQWRGYAGSEGFAIGFDPQTVFNTIHRAEPVIYSPHDQQYLLRAQLTEILNSWPGRHRLPREGEFDGVGGAMLELVSQTLARFKDEGFSEEQEWRVWTSAPLTTPFGPQRPAVRVNRNRLVPYVPLNFDASRQHPVKSIVVGPSPDPKGSLRATSVLLGSLGLHETVELHESKIPWRIS